MSIRIGIIDSGLGGLFMLHELQKKYPFVDLLYVADYKYNPYGLKDSETIKYRLLVLSSFFKEKIDILIIACNTASIFSDIITGNFLKYDVIEPTIEYVRKKHVTRVGILATNKTIKEKVYQNQLSEINVRYSVNESSDIVDMIEQGSLNSDSMMDLLKDKIRRFQKEGIKDVILGCTHFDIIKNILIDIAPNVNFFSSILPLVDMLGAVLNKFNKDVIGKTEIYKTYHSEVFDQTIRTLKINYINNVLIEI